MASTVASREALQVLVRAGKSSAGPRAVTQQGESRKRASQPPSSQGRGEPAQGRGAQSRVIRVIGGSMRGRRWRFPDIPDVRPTPDRVRETLFNWLGPRIVGARCLDLFAGSGALGLESLSRGASTVVFVEQHVAIARALSAVMVEWNVQGAAVSRTDAFSYLRGTPQPFDIVFLDPPFAAGLVGPAAALLEQKGWLAPEALIYLESAAREPRPDLPADWKELKAKRAGEVGYHLLARTPGAAVPA